VDRRQACTSWQRTCCKSPRSDAVVSDEDDNGAASPTGHPAGYVRPRGRWTPADVAWPENEAGTRTRAGTRPPTDCGIRHPGHCGCPG